MGSVKVNTKEFLSKDIIEEEYLNIYKLMSYMQIILGSCRVHVKDRFMTSPSFYQKLYTVLCIMFAIALYILNIKFNFSKLYEYTAIYCLIVFVSGLDVLSHICNIFHVRFINSESNVEFYLKLKNIDRIMKIDINKVMNRMLHRVNMITVTFIVSLLVFMLVVMLIYKTKVSFLCLFGTICNQVTFLLEMINCSNIVFFFSIRMRFLNSIIRNHINPINSEEHFNPLRYTMATKRQMQSLAAKIHDFRICATDVYLNEVFDGFEKFQNVFRFQVFIFCAKLVPITLLGFEFSLFAIQRNLLNLVEILILAAYPVIDFLIALFLSVRCEIFFKEVKETKRLCIAVMLKYQQGPLREKARKMLKMIEESPPCFSVYDMWQLDAHIFVKIFSLVTTLMVTLLQFAFL